MTYKLSEYDPMDEKKQFTLEEFIALAKQELDEYQKVWSEKPRNQHHSQAHTWREWWNTIQQYWSW